MKKTKRQKDDERLLLELRDMMPTVQCIPGCSDCCGPVGFAPVEKQRLARQGKLVALSQFGITTIGADCPYLFDGRCSIYNERPLVCRLYGAVPRCHPLTCPHGACASYPLSGVLLNYVEDNYRKLLRSDRVLKAMRKRA